MMSSMSTCPVTPLKMPKVTAKSISSDRGLENKSLTWHWCTTQHTIFFSFLCTEILEIKKKTKKKPGFRVNNSQYLINLTSSYTHQTNTCCRNKQLFVKKLTMLFLFYLKNSAPTYCLHLLSTGIVFPGTNGAAERNCLPLQDTYC